MNYQFIDKGLYFPEQEILTIGDLHIGYEYMLHSAGLTLPETQVDEIIEDLGKIFSQVKSDGNKIKKIVFIGDIKHYFGYEWKEKSNFKKVLVYLEEKGLKENNVILIKGNHDKFDFSGKKMKNFYFYKGIAFVHGNLEDLRIFEPRVEAIVMGHLHPSVIISNSVRSEKYKCFLTGEWNKKKVFVLPSFFRIIEGTSVNEYKNYYKNLFSILPQNIIINFEVFVIGEDLKTYSFGKVKDL